jgi:hypothetical protein
MNQGYRWKKKLFSEQGRAQLDFREWRVENEKKERGLSLRLHAEG